MNIRRIIVSALVAGCIGTGTFAFASSLSVNSNTLASGSASTLSCQPATPVVVTYPVAGIAYDALATTSGYKITSVTVTGVAAGCVGSTAQLELTQNDDGTALASATSITLVLGDNTFAIPGVVDAALVTGASIVIV